VSKVRNLGILVAVIGIVGILIGLAFIGLGVSRNFELKTAMQVLI